MGVARGVKTNTGNGVADATRLIVLSNNATAAHVVMGSQTWLYTAQAAGEIIQMQGILLVSVGGTDLYQDGTTLTAVFLHP